MSSFGLDYFGPLVARAEAKTLGLTRYFTTKLCTYGHKTQRLVSNKVCIGCKTLRDRQRPPESVTGRKKNWRLRNLQKSLEATREWNRKNPYHYRNKRRRRRAKERGAEGHFTSKDISQLHDAQGGLCFCGACLRDGFQVDHKTPLSRGGTNWPSNLQLLCPSCNGRKGTKTDEEWRLGTLAEIG